MLLPHLHADHFPVAPVRAIPGEPLLIMPRGARSFAVKSLGRSVAERCVELAPGDETTISGVRVSAVPAQHDGARGPWSKERADAVGYVVEGASRTWFTGDTGLFDEMSGDHPVARRRDVPSTSTSSASG